MEEIGATEEIPYISFALYLTSYKAHIDIFMTFKHILHISRHLNFSYSHYFQFSLSQYYCKKYCFTMIFIMKFRLIKSSTTKTAMIYKYILLLK